MLWLAHGFHDLSSCRKQRRGCRAFARHDGWALMDFLGFLITQCLNALSEAALLFFLGVGLTLIFGIMRIINFAHGAFFMLGAYVGYSAMQLTGSFWGALLVAPLAVGGVGAAFELGILRRLYGREGSAFLMVTFGLTPARNRR